MSRSEPTRGEKVLAPLETYLRDINETPLLTAKEEEELARRVQAGDSAARDQMVRANLRLVVSIAQSYSRKGLALEDLIAEGNLGLLRAVEGYDPLMNTRFSTYASFWIKQSIRRGLINTAKTVRIPAHAVDLISKWRRASAELQEKLGRTPTQEEVAKRLKLSKKKLNIVKKAFQIHNSTFFTEKVESGASLDEVLRDERTKAPETQLSEADDLRHVLDLLDKMDERYAKILRLRFGLNNEDPLTLAQVGDRLGLTRERVRQLEREALRLLAERLQRE